MRVLVTGASGLIGRAVTRALIDARHEVSRLTRAQPRQAREFRWDPDRGVIDPGAFTGCQAAIHLAGATIAGRWTRARKAAILASRRIGTRLLVDAMRRADPPPTVLISASAVGFYGDRGDEVLREDSGPGRGFLSEVTRAWEEEAGRAAEFGARVVCPRFGVVLDAHEGALPRLALPFRLGIGGPIGSGRQWVSWVTRHDLVRAILHALGRNDLRGPLNVVSPQPVAQRDLAVSLGQLLHRPSWLPLPDWALSLALGEMGRELLLYSQRVVPARLEAAGFTFDHPGIDAALRATFSTGASPRN